MAHDLTSQAAGCAAFPAPHPGSEQVLPSPPAIKPKAIIREQEEREVLMS